MNGMMVMAMISVASMMGLGGAAVASEDVAKALGMHKGDGTGDCGEHQWNHQYQWCHAGDTSDTPYDWNYTWSYDYDCCNETCPSA